MEMTAWYNIPFLSAAHFFWAFLLMVVMVVVLVLLTRPHKFGSPDLVGFTAYLVALVVVRGIDAAFPESLSRLERWLSGG